ncbi:MAG: hypothetical protein ACHQAX_06015 [Gammaproteobacteria bacterium]
MAHYDNLASRVIDYSNRQLFEGFFDFFIHGKKTFQGYWEFHRPIKSGVTTLKKDDDPEENAWKYLAFFHYMAAFLTRLILLPFAAAIYTLSRTGLIVLNPFTAWANNPRKALYMGLVWAVPTFFVLNNIYGMIPSISFNTLLTADNFQRVSTAFGMSEGIWGMSALAMGGLIISTFLSFGMASVLHLAKKAAQKGNAVELKDPRQTNLYDPAHKTIHSDGASYDPTQLIAQPDTVLITAPKHRSVALYSGSKGTAMELNEFNDLNAASDNLRYAYYKNKENKPIIWSAAPGRVKNLLTAFDAAYAAHGKPGFFMKSAGLTYAYEQVVERNSGKPDTITREICQNYRIDAAIASYAADPLNQVFVKKRAFNP